MSKGSRPRRRQIPRDVFDNNWDQIFGKKAKETKPAKPKK